MSALAVERFDDFTGGINLRADQFQLARNESPDMLNIEIDPRGGVFSRGGMREINTTAVSGTWTPERLYTLTGATNTILLTTETKVYKSTGTNFSTLQFSAGNDVTSTSSHGACMAQWGDTMYIATGSAGVGGYKWKSTDTYATALTHSGTNPHDWQAYGSPVGGKMPTAEHLLVHANKMFASNTTENAVYYPNRVRWSHENLPEDWLQSDYIDFDGGGTGVTGMAVFAGQLLVFKPRAIYVVFGYDSTDFQVVELTSKLGISSHHHMTTSEDGIYFYSHPYGVFFYNGTSIIDVSENLKAMYSLGYINNALANSISVSYINRRVWVALPYSTSGTPASNVTANFVLDPTLGRGSWVKHSTGDGYGVLGGTDWISSSGEVKFLAIHPTLPRVLQVDMFDYEKDRISGAEVNFTSFYRTGWVDGKTYSMNKMWRRPDIIAKQTDTSRTINVDVFHNYEESTARKSFSYMSTSGYNMVWGESNWNTSGWYLQSTGSQLTRGANLGLARSVQLLFTGPSGQYWGISSIGYKYNPRRIKG